MVTVDRKAIKERMKSDLIQRLGTRRPHTLYALAQEASAIFAPNEKKYGGLAVMIDLVEDVVGEVYFEITKADRVAGVKR